MSNINKGNSYKHVLSQLKYCSKATDIFHLIGLIACCESLITDRLVSLHMKLNKIIGPARSKEINKISFGDFLEIYKEELNRPLKINSKDGRKIETKNLYAELWQWKEMRNNVIHSVCKSIKPVSHKSTIELYNEIQCTCLLGYRLARLIIKFNTKN